MALPRHPSFPPYGLPSSTDFHQPWASVNHGFPSVAVPAPQIVPIMVRFGAGGEGEFSNQTRIVPSPVNSDPPFEPVPRPEWVGQPRATRGNDLDWAAT